MLSTKRLFLGQVRISKIIPLFLGLAISWTARGDVIANFYDLKLESLSSFAHVDTSSLRGHPSIWVLVQPDCGSCKAQLKDLNCLPQEIEKVALGSQGSREQLIAALRITGFRGKKVMISPQFRSLLKTHATPTLYIVTAAGELKKSIQGLTPCEKLRAEFSSTQ